MVKKKNCDRKGGNCTQCNVEAPDPDSFKGGSYEIFAPISYIIIQYHMKVK